MKNDLKKLIINSLLLSIGLILHQITPPILFGVKPDFALVMLFIIVIINNDYKQALLSGIVCGILTALTTGFPGGQLPNIIDKIITANVMFALLIPFRKSLTSSIKNLATSVLVGGLGTIISGSIFLGSALLIVGLPAPFKILFAGVVLPAALINAIATPFIMMIFNISTSRAKVNLFSN
ncbi:tryptophan transporter [Clostridium sp. DL1XJH146]